MVVWRQLWKASDLDRENGFGDGVLQRDHKLSLGASVSSQPIEHPRVGSMVVPFPGATICKVVVPVRVREPLRVLVERIARVGMLKRRLSERKQQTRHYAEME